MVEMNEELIKDSNLKDFIKQDLKALESYIKDSDDSKLNLTPDPIYKNSCDHYKKINKKDKNGRFIK